MHFKRWLRDIGRSVNQEDAEEDAKSHDLPDVLDVDAWYDALEQFLQHRLMSHWDDPLVAQQDDRLDEGTAAEEDDEVAEGRESQGATTTNKSKGISDVSSSCYIISSRSA